jgi:hypothetical protein
MKIKSYSEFKENKLQEQLQEEQYKMFEETGFINTEDINEAYIPKPTRSISDLEKGMQEIADKYHNTKSHQEKLGDEYTKKYRDMLNATLVKALPKGVSIPIDRMDIHASFINFNMASMGNKEIASLSLSTDSWGLQEGETVKDFKQKVVDKAYLNYYTGWCYFDSEEVGRLQALGELAKIFASKSSKPINDYLDQLYTIKKEYYAQLKELGNSYSLEREYREMYDEYMSQVFNSTVLKTDFELSLNKPYTEDSGRKTRWAPQVNKVVIKKIKPKTMDVELFYTDSENPSMSNWSVNGLFNVWINYSEEGQKLTSNWDLKNKK